MSLTIYHNPRCTKSRETLELLKGKGLEPDVIEYLKTPPTAAELDAVLKKLGLEPDAIVRTKEDAYATSGLKNPNLSRAEKIAILVKFPILIERPIVVNGGKAALGRPPEKVLEII
ncbi:MAG TPA: arsenate reductase (glutaredoxin) [bacterium]|nr:arsenate reductase (glutaredoxin) [bacterium]